MIILIFLLNHHYIAMTLKSDTNKCNLRNVYCDIAYLFFNMFKLYFHGYYDNWVLKAWEIKCWPWAIKWWEQWSSLWGRTIHSTTPCPWFKISYILRMIFTFKNWQNNHSTNSQSLLHLFLYCLFYSIMEFHCSSHNKICIFMGIWALNFSLKYLYPIFI